MTRNVFDRVYEKVSQQVFFVRKIDALRRAGIHHLQRITGGLRMMSLGVAADAVYKYVRMSDSAMLESLEKFSCAVIVEFGDEYLRSPSTSDMERILRINAARGFPDMAGSIDCRHYVWKNCPTRLAGQFQGKGKKPTIVLEGIADAEGWIWYMRYEFL